MRLTSFAHGGGCGCKIPPGILRDILGAAGSPPVPPGLLVGNASSDDAAVWRVDERTAVVATTDFFMPIVDDPFDFGRIAATNALSDIYAMGARPVMALAILAMPVDRLPLGVIARIMDGGAEVCRAAGIPLAGGHSIDSVEPIFGLVGIGLVDPRRVKRNDTAQAGDVLVLGKPLGVGILSAALKKQALSPDGYDALLAVTTRLNAIGADLAAWPDVHAMTDVTGFGLLGHLLEMCRGAGLGAEIDPARVPILPQAALLARQGYVTGASHRNWAGYGAEIDLPPDLPDHLRHLLCDPQTSGGLLVACGPDSAGPALRAFRDAGFADAAAIGRLVNGAASIRVGRTERPPSDRRNARLDRVGGGLT